MVGPKAVLLFGSHFFKMKLPMLFVIWHSLSMVEHRHIWKFHLCVQPKLKKNSALCGSCMKGFALLCPNPGFFIWGSIAAVLSWSSYSHQTPGNTLYILYDSFSNRNLCRGVAAALPRRCRSGCRGSHNVRQIPRTSQGSRAIITINFKFVRY